MNSPSLCSTRLPALKIFSTPGPEAFPFRHPPVQPIVSSGTGSGSHTVQADPGSVSHSPAWAAVGPNPAAINEAATTNDRIGLSGARYLQKGSGIMRRRGVRFRAALASSPGLAHDGLSMEVKMSTERSQPVSPACLAHETDDAYMGYATRDELAAFLNELLEAER